MSAPRQSRIDVAEDWRPFWQRIYAEEQVETEKDAEKVFAAVNSEIDRRIEVARAEEVSDASVAAVALDTILKDQEMRARLRHILSEFLHGSGFRWPFRQGHLREIASDLKAAEDELRDLMDQVTFQAEMLMQAAVAFRDVPGLPDGQDLARAHADAWFGVGFVDGMTTVTNLARHARALEGAVLAAYGPDEGNKALADKLQGDERDHLLSDLAALWHETGRKIPKGKPKEREPFIEFVAALHAAIGAGEIPKIEEKVSALAT